MNARSKIETAKARLGSWRAVGMWLGNKGKATACNRLVKHPDFRPSIELVEAIEAATLPPAIATVEACPDCGSVHTGRCHGRPVARVQIISGKARRRKRYHRPCLDDAKYERLLRLDVTFAENERLRAALQEIVDYGARPRISPMDRVGVMLYKAQAALDAAEGAE